MHSHAQWTEILLTLNSILQLHRSICAVFFSCIEDWATCTWWNHLAITGTVMVVAMPMCSKFYMLNEHTVSFCCRTILHSLVNESRPHSDLKMNFSSCDIILELNTFGTEIMLIISSTFCRIRSKLAQRMRGMS